jgi:hypothetical protein
VIAPYLFLAAAAAFFLSTVAQVFLAGMAIFANPFYWGRHISFVHAFEFLPLIMLLTGWLGRLPKQLLWLSAGLFGLIYLQYFNANFRQISPVVAATHPVTALLVVGMAYVTMMKAWKTIQIIRSNP